MKGFISLTVGVCIVTLLTACGISAAAINFDDLVLSPDSYWNGQAKWEADGSPYPATPAESPYNYDDGFASGGAEFSNRFSATTYGDAPFYGHYTSWSGFAYSNMVDTTTAGYTNQYSVYTGSAYSGNNFGVAYYTTYGGITPSITFASEIAPTSLKMTNTTYAALSMQDGDMFTDQMAEGDWFKVTISAKDSIGQVTGSSIDVMLGEWQVDGSLTIANEWMNVDLTALGSSVKTIEFAMSSYDASTGFEGQWATYFAIDNVSVPEPITVSLLAMGGLALVRRRNSR